MDLHLKNKIVIVTGGSEGIGKAAAWRFSSEKAIVIICGRRLSVLEQTANSIQLQTGVDVTPIVADVNKPEQLKSMVDQIIRTFGRIDVLVNNAGTAAGKKFDQVTDPEWYHDIDLKLMAAVRTSKLVIPYMKKQGAGRIINITHVGGKAPGSNSSPSSVTRAAGIALTKAMSKDYAKDNILVNTVCVGFLKADQHKRAHAKRQTSSKSPITLKQWYIERGQSVPLGRVGESHEAGDVIVFLASDMASYVTGTSINVDGGAGATV